MCARETTTLTAAQMERLADALRHQRAYLLIYQDYLKEQPRPDFQQVLEALEENTQDAIELLAHRLRQAGRRPIEITPAERLLQQGLERRGTASKLEFILTGMENTADFYRGQAQESNPEAAEVWQTLLQGLEPHMPPLRTLLDKVQHRNLSAGDEEAPS